MGKNHDGLGAYRGCLLALMVCLMPLDAAAQTAPGGMAPAGRPERPYRGLFGGGSGNIGQSLTLDGSLGGGTSGSSVPSAGSGDGAVTGSATVSYSIIGDRMQFYVSNAVIADYYAPTAGKKAMPKDIAGASFTFSPLKSTRVGLGMNYKNVPEFSASDMFGDGLVIPLNQDLRYTVTRYNRYQTMVDVTQTISSRARASFGASYARGMFGDSAWTILTGSGSFDYKLSRDISVYAGYQDGGQRDETNGVSVRDRHPRMSFGLDFNRPISLSRRTTLKFTTGTAGVHDRLTDKVSYYVIGGVRLDREIGRTWYATALYDRNVRPVESLGRTLLYDAATVALNGSFSRRLQFQTRVGASTGDLVNSEGVNTKAAGYFAGVQLSFAFNKLVALATDYGYYKYRLPSDVSLDTSKQNYQSVRTYLQLWVPLLTRRKN